MNVPKRSLIVPKTSTYLRLASDFIQTVKERVVVNRFNRIVQNVTDSLQSKTENEHDYGGKCLFHRGDKYGVWE